MATYYTVIQYVPDPIADERINTGVIVFGEGRIKSRFVDKWDRISRFGDRDITELRAFAKQIEEASRHALTYGDSLDERAIREMATHWTGSIQLTKPRGSLLTHDELMEDVGRRYLPSNPPPVARGHNRIYARNLAVEAVRKELVRHGGPKAYYQCQIDHEIKGRLQKHIIDLTVGIRVLRTAAYALSFESEADVRLEKDVQAMGFKFNDIRETHPDLKLAAIVLPGDGTSGALELLTRVMDSVDGSVVTRERIPQWAEDVAADATGGAFSASL